MPSFQAGLCQSFEGLIRRKALETKLYTSEEMPWNNAAISHGKWDLDEYYLPSLSSKTMVYKGMFVCSLSL